MNHPSNLLQSMSPPEPAHHAKSWIPIRSLAPRHSERIKAHLIALPEADRYLRFGYPATDEQIAKYVDDLNFSTDELFGVFNRKLKLVAMAHLAYLPLPANADQPTVAEFGVSVLSNLRGRGLGARLFEHATLHARNRGVDRLFIHALSENTAMLKIARNAGASVERDGSESEAWLKLPPDTLGSQVDEILENRVAELDYQVKRQVSRVSMLWDVFREVTAKGSPSGEAAKE